MTKRPSHLHSTTASLAVALASVAIAAASPANAQAQSQAAAADTTAVAPGEIVVTATRRAESLSKVPQSVTALSQTSLDQRGIKDMSGIVRQTPGIQFDPSGFGNQSNIAIRGVSSTVGAATTGVYIDDTPIQSRQVGYSTTNAFPAVFDLQRVEVLRGPQGTLFGAGSEGGTVRFITGQPSLTDTRIYARGEASSTQGGAMSGEFGVSGTMPLITDKLGLSASIWFRRDGGWVDRKNGNPALANAPLLKDVNTAETQVGRFALRWTPVEGLEITPSLFYQRRTARDSDNYWETLSDPKNGQYISGQPQATPDNDRFYLPALAISYDFGSVQLISNTSYYVRDQHAEIDYSTLWPAVFGGASFIDPAYRATALMRNDQRTFTQEARLQSTDKNARLTWVLGAFYAKSVQHFRENVVDPDFGSIFGGIPPEVIFGVPLVDGQYSLAGSGRGADEQLAGFAEGTFAITPQLKITAGLRVSHTKFEGASVFDGPVSGLQLQLPQQVTENPITPKVSVNWQATPDVLVYATAAKGYRIGGTNAPVPLSVCGADLNGFGFSNVPQTYKSDSLWSYEGGVKGRVNRAISFAGSVFLVDWKDIQQNVYLQHCGAQFTANLGKARSKGFDLQVTAKLAEGLTLDGTVGYTNATLTQNVAGGALATAGDHLETHPWTATIGGNYEVPINDEATVYLRGDYQYKSRSKQTTVTDPLTNAYDPGAIRTPQLSFASLRLGWRKGPADVSLFVDNLTNNRSRVSRQIEVSGVGSYRSITLRPRTFGLTVLLRQ
ncbi:TonB-dependent receptor [Novosphingobium sp.]|uniref:TonB-dependent receptor n=1 Tax=Novosphingobium sp. TaxID=1874826 RepID=UPI0038BDFC3E